MFFFFKQRTAYEMRISDWSSDVCSSDPAGLWRPTDEWGDSYTMVMVDAVPEMMEIHDRMPAILYPGDFDTWLRAPAHEAFELVTQRSEEHTSELQSLMRISYAVFCLKKKNTNETKIYTTKQHKNYKSN